MPLPGQLLPPPARVRAPSVHDGLAVTGFLLAFLVPPLGLALSWVSAAAAHRDGRDASGLAIAGIVASAIIMALFILTLL